MPFSIFYTINQEKDWKSYIGAETSCGQTERTETSGNRMDELCRSSRSLAKIWEKVFLCHLFPYGGHQLSIDISWITYKNDFQHATSDLKLDTFEQR